MTGTAMGGLYKTAIESNTSVPRNLKGNENRARLNFDLRPINISQLFSGSFENEMIFHLEEDGTSSVSDQSGHSLASYNANRQPILSGRNILDKSKLNVRINFLTVSDVRQLTRSLTLIHTDS
jgi:hypothetical protein